MDAEALRQSKRRGFRGHDPRVLACIDHCSV